MNAKQFLRLYEEATKRANRYKTEYEKEHELIDTVRSTLSSDGLPHSNGISRKVEDQAIRLAEKALKWKEAELDAIMVRQEVFDVIRDIPEVDGEILYERYINLLKWEEVCIKVHLSWYSVHEHHKKALRIVQEKINEKPNRTYI